MKNITVSVPDDVYRQARIKAAEKDTTVSRVVRNFLEQYASAPGDPGRRIREILAEIRQDRADGPGFRATDNLSRDQAHDRDALR